MSDPLRIGLVAEGITDKLIIQAAIESLLGERRFILRLLQPEESMPFEPLAPSLSQGRGGVESICGAMVCDKETTDASKVIFCFYSMTYSSYTLMQM